MKKKTILLLKKAFILSLKIILVVVCVALILIVGRKYYLLYWKIKRLDVSVKPRLAIMKNLYHYISDIADKNNIKLFLLFGTLLGQQRNNKLICYDYDVDFGVLYSDVSKLVKALTSHIKTDSSLYEIDFVDNILATKIIITHKKSNISADIDVYEKTKNRSFIKKNNYLTFLYDKYIANACKTRNLPYDWLMPLKSVSFLGNNIYIPNKPEQILKSEYGKDYLIPNNTCNKDCSKCVEI